MLRSRRRHVPQHQARAPPGPPAAGGPDAAPAGPRGAHHGRQRAAGPSPGRRPGPRPPPAPRGRWPGRRRRARQHQVHQLQEIRTKCRQYPRVHGGRQRPIGRSSGPRAGPTPPRPPRGRRPGRRRRARQHQARAPLGPAAAGDPDAVPAVSACPPRPATACRSFTRSSPRAKASTAAMR
jgi:translation initiation factor IF-2